MTSVITALHDIENKIYPAFATTLNGQLAANCTAPAVARLFHAG